jgi:mannose-6-phosphate isomerase
MPPFFSRPYLLENKIRHHHWGSKGSNAFIPKLLGIEPISDLPFAELWIGAHPNDESNVVIDDVKTPLSEFINNNPSQILGKKVHSDFNGSLPFLLKVVSVDDILSIQVHPNKEQAKYLHAIDPVNYPDENHKPEIAVALDSLTAFVGFKNLNDLIKTLKKYPEITKLFGIKNANKIKNSSTSSIQIQKDIMKELYFTLLNSFESQSTHINNVIINIYKRLRESSKKISEEENLFLDLYRKYPDDLGLLFLFLLNLVHLQRGQGVFMEPGIPHAYVKGNMVECMANSDNVVRAGLTHKFKDTQRLIEILNFEKNPKLFKFDNLDEYEIVFDTPTEEYQLSILKINPHEEREEKGGNTLNIFLITKGNCTIRWKDITRSFEEVFHQGQSIFIPASLEKFTLHSDCSTEIFKVKVPN